MVPRNHPGCPDQEERRTVHDRDGDLPVFRDPVPGPVCNHITEGCGAIQLRHREEEGHVLNPGREGERERVSIIMPFALLRYPVELEDDPANTRSGDDENDETGNRQCPPFSRPRI